jgi:hypothetical protein
MLVPEMRAGARRVGQWELRRWCSVTIALSAKGGIGVLKVDGNTVATEKMEHTLPFNRTFGEAPSVTHHRSRRAVDGGKLGRTSASRR